MRLKQRIKHNPVFCIPYKIYCMFVDYRFKLTNTEEIKYRMFGYQTIKPMYIIRRTHKAGFFSNFFFVLGHIVYADSKGYEPVVDMYHYRTLYNEKRKCCNTNNAWEYYFRQPSEYGLARAYRAKTVVLSNGDYHYDLVPYYEGREKKFPDRDFVCRLNPFVDKYIHIRPEIESEADLLFQSFGPYRFAGIHIRGTDMHTTPNHPIPPTVDQYIACVRRLLATNAIDKVFLCTDEGKLVSIMREVFGDVIVCTDAFRSTDGKCIHKNCPRHYRKKHKYMLGREVLVDALLLSKCEYLICGHSNVAYAAIVMNKNAYKDVFVIENEEQNKNME